MTTVELSVIIVNWNTRDLLADCLASIYAGVGDLSVEVIVLDNASTDGSAAVVREQFPQVRLIESCENLGFARGNNIALRQATGEYLLLLNPDTVVVDDALTRLVAALAADPSLGAISPQLIYPDASPQASSGDFPCLRNELPLLRRPSVRSPLLTASYHSALIPVDWAKGACLMIRRRAWEQVGQLDEEYWLYTEEADWCYRARQMGWEIAVVTDAKVVHIEQAAARQRLAHSLVQFARSRALFLRKHRSRLSAWLFWWVYVGRSLLWLLLPIRSPLGKGHSNLSSHEIRSAYRSLLGESVCRITRWSKHDSLL